MGGDSVLDVPLPEVPDLAAVVLAGIEGAIDGIGNNMKLELNHTGALPKRLAEALEAVRAEDDALAADELVARGWGFHKELKAWLSRVAGTEPVQKTERGERGSFWIFDAGAWDRVRKDNFNLQYDQLEARPAVKRDAPATSRAQSSMPQSTSSLTALAFAPAVMFLRPSWKTLSA